MALSMNFVFRWRDKRMVIETKYARTELQKYLKIKDLILRQLSSITISIIVNSRVVFVIALIKCNYVAFGEQNKNQITEVGIEP